MYNIRLLYDVEGWAYYWKCIALQKYAPSNYNASIGSNYGQAFKSKKHDMVLQLAFSYAGDLRKHMNDNNYKFPLVSSYTVGWNYANHWLPPAIKSSDFVIINNKGMWENFGKHPKTKYIPNGVDRDIFNIKKPIKMRTPKVLWCGSTCHRKVKNYDTIIEPLSQKLKKYNIPFEFKLINSVGKQRLNQKQMSYWYNTGSIYLVASKSEGTPNPALEAAACGCTVVSTKVGNMPELIKDGENGYLCDTNIDSLLDGILKAKDNLHYLENNMQNSIQSWDWKIKSKQFYNFFTKVINNEI